MSQTVDLKVAMSCQGCVGAVKRVLEKMEGVESYDINLKEQKVTVKGNVQPEAVFQTVSKSGKKTSFWEQESTPDATKEKPEEAVAVAPDATKEKPEEAVAVAPDSTKEKPADTVAAA